MNSSLLRDARATVPQSNTAQRKACRLLLLMMMIICVVRQQRRESFRTVLMAPLDASGMGIGLATCRPTSQAIKVYATDTVAISRSRLSGQAPRCSQNQIKEQWTTSEETEKGVLFAFFVFLEPFLERPFLEVIALAEPKVQGE